MRIMTGIAALAAFLALTGCGLTDHAAPVPGVTCLDASGIVTNRFLKGAIDGGTKLVAARAIKSHDFEDLYFVAVYFSVDGTDDQVGVWVTNSLEPAGGLIPVDATAKEYSARAATGGAVNVTATDASIADALSCLN